MYLRAQVTIGPGVQNRVGRSVACNRDHYHGTEREEGSAAQSVKCIHFFPLGVTFVLVMWGSCLYGFTLHVVIERLRLRCFGSLYMSDGRVRDPCSARGNWLSCEWYVVALKLACLH